MDGWLKQSTAVTLKIGPFVDSTDGNTAETALTIAQADVRLSKNGGNIAQKTEATSCTHDELGMYDCPVDATDTGTLGRLDLVVAETGALVVRHTYMVVPANVWDSLFGADALQVDVAQWLGTAVATPTTVGVPEVDVTHVAGSATTATLDTIKTDTAAILVDTGTTLDGRIPAALVGGRMDADIGAKTGNVALSTQEKADVNAEVVDAVATDTYAEPGQGTPAATTTLAAKLNYLYKAWRNRVTQTATQYTLYADNATTVDQKAAVSDDATTFDKGEVATGP